MIPIVTPKEMAAIDAAAPEPVDVLIGRAGAAVARAAKQLLGGTYGRSVNVIAGKGNNGNDGRVAGQRLADAGVLVRVFDAGECPATLPPSDLVIDAAYGTGFRGSWRAPRPGASQVLAVDIPSGVDGLTGTAADGVLAAERTVTFAALKPGLLIGDGWRLSGEIRVADIGLDTGAARAHVVEGGDVAGWWRPRPVEAHKWTRAVRIVAGSAGMTGAATLAATAAMRAGAGIVWLSSPGAGADAGPVEVVGRRLPATGWASELAGEADRFGAMVIGPGLGRSDETISEIRSAVATAPCPLVVDGDGLAAVGQSAPTLRDRPASTVLTPHDGEYRLLTGADVEADRFAAARRLAGSTGAVVLLKGPTTIIAEPLGEVRVVTSGDQRLATAGSGDVLAGIIGALLASGMTAFDAAAGGAWLHGTAASLRPPSGLVAGDVCDGIGPAIDSLVR